MIRNKFHNRPRTVNIKLRRNSFDVCIRFSLSTRVGKLYMGIRNYLIHCWKSILRFNIFLFSIFGLLNQKINQINWILNGRKFIMNNTISEKFFYTPRIKMIYRRNVQYLLIRAIKIKRQTRLIIFFLRSIIFSIALYDPVVTTHRLVNLDYS